MRLQLFSLLAALAPFALADVEFTSPAAGASVAAGAITISWKDSGVSPPLSELTPQTLQLVVGGNEVGTNTQFLLAVTQFTSADSVQMTISPGIASAVENGFYFQVISAATAGGTVTNYSPRFSLTGMTGTTLDTYTAAAAAVGSTKGPPTVNQVAAAPAAGAGADTAAAGAAEFTVPYYLQTGLTKYAPMQPVPPTKITAKNPTPLNPTSAFSIATTWMPIATIATTITESQTFSVSSMENTAAAQSQPTGDMAKFLMRWKD